MTREVLHPPEIGQVRQVLGAPHEDSAFLLKVYYILEPHEERSAVVGEKLIVKSRISEKDNTAKDLWFVLDGQGRQYYVYQYELEWWTDPV